MLSLQDKIIEFGSKAKKYQERNISEPGTKSGLIEPLFREIGWDFENIENVEPEFPVKLGEETNPADYARKIDGEPSLFIEAKRVNLDIKGAIADGTAKAIKKGVPWLIATNGDEIAVLKIDEKIPDPERVVFHIVLSESVDDEKKIKENAELLDLLSPENVSSSKLESFSMGGNRQFVVYDSKSLCPPFECIHSSSTLGRKYPPIWVHIRCKNNS